MFGSSRPRAVVIFAARSEQQQLRSLDEVEAIILDLFKKYDQDPKFHGFSRKFHVDSFGKIRWDKKIGKSSQVGTFGQHSFLQSKSFKTALQDSSQFLDPIEFKALMQDLQQRLDFPKDEILLFLAEVQGVFSREKLEVKFTL